MAGRSSFGSAKKTASGRYRAFYTADGVTHSAGHTFPNKLQAENWLKDEWDRRRKGTWTDRRSSTTLRCFVEEQWWPRMTHIAERTGDDYRLVLKTWIYPPFERAGRTPLALGDMPLAQITEDDVRAWYAAARARGHDVRLAKAYRLLSEVMRAAAELGVIARSPVRIKGAGAEVAPERTVLSADEMVALANSMEPRYRAMVLLATFGALRWGESLGLQRRDVDMARGGVTLRRVVSQPDNGKLRVTVLKARKKGEIRWIDLPPELMDLLTDHLADFVAAAPSAWLFMENGEPLLRKTFGRKLSKAASTAGLDAITFQTLRHTGATWFAEEGATVREVMERLGHRSERMAMRYQHAAAERMKSLASHLGGRLTGNRVLVQDGFTESG